MTSPRPWPPKIYEGALRHSAVARLLLLRERPPPQRDPPDPGAPRDPRGLPGALPPPMDLSNKDNVGEGGEMESFSAAAALRATSDSLLTILRSELHALTRMRADPLTSNELPRPAAGAPIGRGSPLPGACRFCPFSVEAAASVSHRDVIERLTSHYHTHEQPLALGEVDLKSMQTWYLSYCKSMTEDRCTLPPTNPHSAPSPDSRRAALRSPYPTSPATPHVAPSDACNALKDLLRRPSVHLPPLQPSAISQKLVGSCRTQPRPVTASPSPVTREGFAAAAVENAASKPDRRSSCPNPRSAEAKVCTPWIKQEPVAPAVDALISSTVTRNGARSIISTEWDSSNFAVNNAKSDGLNSGARYSEKSLGPDETGSPAPRGCAIAQPLQTGSLVEDTSGSISRHALHKKAKRPKKSERQQAYVRQPVASSPASFVEGSATSSNDVTFKSFHHYNEAPYVLMPIVYNCVHPAVGLQTMISVDDRFGSAMNLHHRDLSPISPPCNELSRSVSPPMIQQTASMPSPVTQLQTEQTGATEDAACKQSNGHAYRHKRFGTIQTVSNVDEEVLRNDNRLVKCNGNIVNGSLAAENELVYRTNMANINGCAVNKNVLNFHHVECNASDLKQNHAPLCAMQAAIEHFEDKFAHHEDRRLSPKAFSEPRQEQWRPFPPVAEQNNCEENLSNVRKSSIGSDHINLTERSGIPASHHRRAASDSLVNITSSIIPHTYRVHHTLPDPSGSLSGRRSTESMPCLSRESSTRCVWSSVGRGICSQGSAGSSENPGLVGALLGGMVSERETGARRVNLMQAYLNARIPSLLQQSRQHEEESQRREGSGWKEGESQRREGSGRKEGELQRREGSGLKEGESKRREGSLWKEGDLQRWEGSGRKEGASQRQEGWGWKEGEPAEQGKKGNQSLQQSRQQEEESQRREGSGRKEGESIDHLGLTVRNWRSVQADNMEQFNNGHHTLESHSQSNDVWRVPLGVDNQKTEMTNSKSGNGRTVMGYESDGCIVAKCDEKAFKDNIIRNPEVYERKLFAESLDTSNMPELSKDEDKFNSFEMKKNQPKSETTLAEIAERKIADKRRYSEITNSRGQSISIEDNDSEMDKALRTKGSKRKRIEGELGKVEMEVMDWDMKRRHVACDVTRAIDRDVIGDSTRSINHDDTRYSYPNRTSPVDIARDIIGERTVHRHFSDDKMVSLPGDISRSKFDAPLSRDIIIVGQAITKVDVGIQCLLIKCALDPDFDLRDKRNGQSCKCIFSAETAQSCGENGDIAMNNGNGYVSLNQGSISREFLNQEPNENRCNENGSAFPVDINNRTYLSNSNRKYLSKSVDGSENNAHRDNSIKNPRASCAIRDDRHTANSDSGLNWTARHPPPEGQPAAGGQGSRPGGAARCEHCGLTFDDEVLHSIHMGCHSHRGPFVCNLCGRECANRYGFTTHILRGHHPP